MTANASCWKLLAAWTILFLGQLLGPGNLVVQVGELLHEALVYLDRDGAQVSVILKLNR